MSFFRIKSIRSRITICFFVLFLVVLFATIFITYSQRTIDIKNQAIEKLTTIRDLKVNRVENWIRERKSDISTISEDLELRELETIFDKQDRTNQDFSIMSNSRIILDRLLNNYSDYSELFIINPKTGIVEISTDESQEGTNKLDKDYFKIPLENREAYISEIYISSTHHQPVMIFSVPIFCLLHTGQHVTGILAARIDLQNSFYPYLQDITGMGDTGETLIVNKEAYALNELRWSKNAPLKLKIGAKAAYMASQGYTGVIEMVDYRGKEVLAAYTHMQETNWGFVAKEDISEIYGPIGIMIKNIIILFILIAFVLFFTSLLLSDSITKPLINMVVVSRKVRSGDLKARNEISTEDEIGYLAESYNQMADFMETKIKIEKGRLEIADYLIPFENNEEINQDSVSGLMKITESNMYAFYVLNPDKSEFKLVFSVGIDAGMVKYFKMDCLEGDFGRAILEKKIVHLKNIPPDTKFKFKTITGTAIPKEIITIPIIVENQVSAIISLASLKKFSPETVEILKNSFSTMNVLFSNYLANKRKNKLFENIKEKNIQLQSMTEELQTNSEELQSQSEELSKQNIELEMQKNQVEEANRLKSEFLSNMSHELRTPLNSIMALSRVLIMQIKNKISTEEGSYLEIIERNGKNLLTIINDILDLSKIEAGKIEIHPQTISLKSIIENIRDSLLPIAREKGIGLNLNCANNLPKIQSDAKKIFQILQNIISNAIKFTEKGSVSIDVQPEDGLVSVKVIDTGIGIEKENIPFIFEEFRQADGSASRRFEGTGLGLAIAKKLADKLDIKIQVDSAPGQGSVFTIYFPLRWIDRCENENISFFSDNEDFSAVKTTYTSPLTDGLNKIENNINQEKSRILMVEDNKETILQVKMVLEKEYYTIDVAEGGKEALEYIKHNIPDGIILDLMMPEIDGFEVLENIRSTPETKKIPVLILTAKDLTKEDFKRLSANHIQQLLLKGAIDKDELIFKIKLMMAGEGSGSEALNNTRMQDKNEYKKIALLNKNVPSRDTAKPLLLIVEDNPDNMTTVKAILKDKFRLLEAIDGISALNKIRINCPDIVLMDINIPTMDGMEVVKTLRREGRTKEIPVIAITAKTMSGDREKAISAGFNDYLTKPMEPEKLLNTINHWIINH